MTSKIVFFLAVAILAVSAGSLAAGEHAAHSAEHQLVIALTTDDFELDETDISDLEIGDAETIYTESGKTIDLLRTAEGVEIYVDGELLETGLTGGGGVHGGHHVVHKHVEVVCDTDEDCEEMVWMSEDEDIDLESLHHEGHHGKVVIIEEKTDTD